MSKPQVKHSKYSGYHHFSGNSGGQFEVFWDDENPGWYWWACFPGCTPDGEPSGPFNSSNQAYRDARN